MIDEAKGMLRPGKNKEQRLKDYLDFLGTNSSDEINNVKELEERIYAAVKNMVKRFISVLPCEVRLQS